MKEDRFIKKFYDRICKFLSVKNISWVAFFFFVISLIPICYLSFFNRASGDDYGYGVYTRAAWMGSHSLMEVAKAVGETVRQYYVSWQGTWFSIAVFSLQPEVFQDHGYVLVVFLMLFLWIGSTILLFWQLFKKECGFSRRSVLLVIWVYLLISIQFVPSTKSAIFWFNGCAHYMLPFAMCQIVVWSLIRFVKNYQIRYLALCSALMLLLGGSSYQPALFSLIVSGYFMLLFFLEHKNKKVFLLLIPVILETIGLVISMKAPGNKVRGGEEFGLSFGRAFGTIGKCFLEGARDAAGYLQEKPLVFVGLAVLFLILLEANISTGKKRQKHPLIGMLALLCLYCAMQAPEIYAGVEVSRGVDNTNFLVFLLAALGCLEIMASWIIERMGTEESLLHKKVVIPGLFCCFVLLAFLRSGIKNSTSWVCLEYIGSGQAADYKEQMELQTSILTDERVKNAVIPFINDEQGPLMSMPATDDPGAWTNFVMSQFYGKDCVIAMPRSEWEEKRKGDGFYD